jgi:hypothetical protein
MCRFVGGPCRSRDRPIPARVAGSERNPDSVTVCGDIPSILHTDTQSHMTCTQTHTFNTPLPCSQAETRDPHMTSHTHSGSFRGPWPGIRHLKTYKYAKNNCSNMGRFFYSIILPSKWSRKLAFIIVVCFYICILKQVLLLRSTCT